MEDMFSRTELLIGKENVGKLKQAKVAIFGIGGVGSYVVEALARVGIGNFILVDKDKIDITNINRQIIATTKNVGRDKVEVSKERILEINPDANVVTYKQFYMPDNKIELTKDVSYIVDAIDTVSAKIALVEEADKLNIPIISSMGTGNKLDPTKFEVSDIYETSVCPLAKVMRKELKKKNIKQLKVVYSKENPIKTQRVPASISFVPSVAGLIIASEVVKDIINVNL